MKLKAQIEAMKVEASRKRREAYKADNWPLYTYEKSPRIMGAFFYALGGIATNDFFTYNRA